MSPFTACPLTARERLGATRPPPFLFAAKLSRFITHLRRLHEVNDPLDLYLARMKLLGDKLGSILVQLPANMPMNIDRLQHFLAQCDPALRWAVEFRHPSWLVPGTFDMLARHRAALCLHDLLPDHPLRITAPFTYVRFHGAGQPDDGKYSNAHLHLWADRLRAWRVDGCEIYAYFNNDAHGHALQNARTLRGLLQ